MNSIMMRCRDCGTRKLIVITDGDRRILDEQNHLIRFCANCAMSTRWAPAVGGALWEPLGGDEALDQDIVDGPRVLLIDDDDAILKVLGKALKIANCDVTAANSARDAAMLLARGDFDFIVSDINMPEFSGIQLFEFLEKHFPEHKDRVIFVTGDTSEQTMQFLRSQRARYLTKPINIHDLLCLIQPSRKSAQAD